MLITMEEETNFNLILGKTNLKETKVSDTALRSRCIADPH